jgi:LPS export ABC transporter protein LptC
MRYLWRTLVLLILGVGGWGAWYLATHPTWGSAPASQNQPAMTVRARSLTITGWQRHGRQAEKLWQVTAHDVGENADGRGQWFREITDGILYREGRPVARFTAGQGQGDQAQNTLTISGGVRLRLEADGTTLTTEELRWQGPQRQLWLPKPVHVTRGDLTLEGRNAHLDLRLGRLSSATVSVRSPSLEFESRRALLRLKERRLELQPVQLRIPAGEGHAKRVVYLADDRRFDAEEVHMRLTITPALRVAAATGLTAALLNASVAAPAPEKKTHEATIDGVGLSNTDKEMVFSNAVVTHRDTKVTADRMVVEKDAGGKTERIIATGKPRVVNERNEVTGEKMIVYPKERRVVVEGSFRVEVRPKPEEKPSSDKKGDLKSQVKDGVVTGDRLEYDYRNKNIAAQGNLKLVSRGRTATGEKLFYRDKTEEAEFFGRVHARDEKGQTFDTNTGLTLALGKGGISRVPGKFTATLLVDEDEEEPDAAPAENKPDKAAAAPKAPAAPDNPAPRDTPSP